MLFVLTRLFSIIDWVDNLNWPPQRVLKLTFQALAPFHWSNEELTLETSALKLLTVVNLRYQLSLWYLITLLYSPAGAAPQFL